MRIRHAAIAISILCVSVSVGSAAAPTFDERVEAQRRLDAVYHANQIGTTRSLAEALTRADFEHKVRTHLKQSRLLEERWNTPITKKMLDRELQRMVQSTRMPARLRELFAALDDDPELIGECLVRPLLADRLARRFFAHDESLEPGLVDASIPQRAWDEWWPAVAAGIDIEGFEPYDGPVDSIPDPQILDGPPCFPDNTWNNGILDVPDARTRHTAVWTGSEMIIWGGERTFGNADRGARYDPATDTWSSISAVNAPSTRYDHTAVWTGSEMIIWGGYYILNTGGRYDPLTDSWTPTSTVNAPDGRAKHTAVWTGSEMIVWGNEDTGGRYNPTTDSWQPTSTVGAPVNRYMHTAVWTGDRMIVWGGQSGTALDSGGVYDPATDSWSATSLVDAPPPRRNHTAVWTGSEMIVWAGDVPGPDNDTTGGRYDPVTDTWQPTSLDGVPGGRELHVAVWTGSEMIIWSGGDPGHGYYTDDGGRYDPTTDSWSPMTTIGLPEMRVEHTAVWTGEEMIVWGGEAFSNIKDTGGRYDPVADAWTPTALGNAPEPRDLHTTVWTGNRMIVWGGSADGGGIQGSGACYDPATDSWHPTTTVGAPDVRRLHTAVWADGEMIVWGGDCCHGKAGYDTGGRYDPLTDAWQPTSTVGAPSGRFYHSAAWTGSEMIIWGGTEGFDKVNDGARYRPTTDTWTPMTTAGAPSARTEQTTVWTGNRMIVWGGRTTTDVKTGGVYDPYQDDWSPTTTSGAPSARSGHTAIWTGDEMIVWGGAQNYTDCVDTGGSYDLATDSWKPTSLVSPPEPRTMHSAVWTGSRMIVWGGRSPLNTRLDNGGIFDPSTDTWTETEVDGAPSGRSHHGAVWTGSEMIVWGGQDPLRSGGRYALGHAVDDDGDGLSECDGDCADADSTAFDRPGVIEGVTISRNQLVNGILHWQSDAPNSGSGTRYDVLRGALDQLPEFDPATCLHDNFGATAAPVIEDPDPGAGFYYLVRGRNVCGFGSWGYSSDATEREATACP